MTYYTLLQILNEAEKRRDNIDLPIDVRKRSAETVSLCKERMAKEGLTRTELTRLAFTS